MVMQTNNHLIPQAILQTIYNLATVSYYRNRSTIYSHTTGIRTQPTISTTVAYYKNQLQYTAILQSFTTGICMHPTASTTVLLLQKSTYNYSPIAVAYLHKAFGVLISQKQVFPNRSS